MGHKVNAVSFRLRKIWDSSYFINNINKWKNLMIQDLYIKKYIERICLHQDKVILKFKLFRDMNTLIIFLKLHFWKNYRNKFLRSKKKSVLRTYYTLKRIPNIKKHLASRIKTFFNFKKVYIFLIPQKKVNFFFHKLVYKSTSFLKYNKYYNYTLPFIKASFINSSARLLSISIARMIERNPKHLQFLSFLKKILNIFYYIVNFKVKVSKKKKIIRGYRIEICGKLNGKTRAKKKVISKGPMPFSTIDAHIDYFFSQAFTKYGIFGIKVWVYLSKKHN